MKEIVVWFYSQHPFCGLILHPRYAVLSLQERLSLLLGSLSQGWSGMSHLWLHCGSIARVALPKDRQQSGVAVAVAVCPKALEKGKSKGVVAAGAAPSWAQLQIGSCLVR